MQCMLRGCLFAFGRQQTTLLTVCERIAAVQPVPGDGAQQLALILPVLQACGDWEAAWEAGKATATYEQQMGALGPLTILVGCLDRWTTAAVLPTAARGAAAAHAQVGFCEQAADIQVG